MMTAPSDDDLELFRDSVRRALSNTSPPARLQTASGDNRSEEATWRLLGVQLGLSGLMLPEEAGGSGLGLAELAVAIEECGARLTSSPLFATAALAVPLLLALDDPDTFRRYGARIASGELTATVALAEADARWDLSRVHTQACPSNDSWLIDGTKHHVVDGARAGLLLIVARTSDGPAVFAVERDAAGLGAEPLVTLDQTRTMARVQLAGVTARRIGDTGCEPALAAATDASRVLLAAEQTGLAQRCLEMLVDYAKTRIQFGRPIGSFQIIKERLADAVLQVEAARSAVQAAARCDDADLARNSRVAAIMATNASIWTSEQTIQLHGGIGFTWDHDAHLYFKRARTSAALLGTVGEHVTALGTILDREIT